MSASFPSVIPKTPAQLMRISRLYPFNARRTSSTDCAIFGLFVTSRGTNTAEPLDWDITSFSSWERLRAVAITSPPSLLARAEHCFTSSRPRPREQPVTSILVILASSSEPCLQVGRCCVLINDTSSDPQS